MHKLESFLRKRVVLAYTFFYTFMFILVNVTFIWLNVRYIDTIVEDQNASLIEMMEHLIEESDEATALIFLEHYGHTHSVYLSYEGLVTQARYETENPPVQYDTHTIYAYNTAYAVIHIDNIQSTFIQSNTQFIVTFNIIFFAVFISGLFMLQLYIRNQTHVIIRDMSRLKKRINSLQLDETYYFDDLMLVDQAFEDKIQAIEALKKAHGQKIRTLTHDIKTPLTILKSTLEGVEQKRLTLNKETIKSMLEEVDIINELVPRIIETPEPKLIKAHNAKQLIKKYIDKVKPLFTDHKITIETDLDDATLKVDEDDFIRIIDHLCMNVYRHAHQTNVLRITLSDHPFTLTVQDQGPAIPNEVQEALKKGLPLAKSSSVGTGIGLFVVRNLVNDYGGALTIDGSEHGNTITILISS